MNKSVTCEDIREEYEKLKHAGEKCKRSLILGGFFDEIFRKELREFNSEKNKLKEAVEHRLKLKQFEHLPMTVIRREHSSVGEYQRRFEDAGCIIDDRTHSMLANAEIRETDEEYITLVKVTPKGPRIDGNEHAIRDTRRREGERTGTLSRLGRSPVSFELQLQRIRSYRYGTIV